MKIRYNRSGINSRNLLGRVEANFAYILTVCFNIRMSWFIKLNFLERNTSFLNTLKYRLFIHGMPFSTSS